MGTRARRIRKVTPPAAHAAKAAPAARLRGYLLRSGAPGAKQVAEKHDRRRPRPPRRFHALLPEARRLLRRGAGCLRFHTATDAHPAAPASSAGAPPPGPPPGP